MSIQQNSLVVPNTGRDLLLDLDNRPITGPDGFATDLTIARFARDSIMNPAIASSKRLAVASSDLEQVRAHTGEVEQLVGFWLHDPATKSSGFQKAYQDAGLPQAGQMVGSRTFRLLTMIGELPLDLGRQHLQPHHRIEDPTMTTATATAVLDARGLSKTFDGHQGLKGLDLQVRDGEFIAVMGPAGSGKSTLLYNISGLGTMTAGKVHFAGQDLGSLSQ